MLHAGIALSNICFHPINSILTYSICCTYKGKSLDFVQRLASHESPTEALLNEWCDEEDATLGTLLEALRAIHRDDIRQNLEDVLGFHSEAEAKVFISVPQSVRQYVMDVAAKLEAHYILHKSLAHFIELLTLLLLVQIYDQTIEATLNQCYGGQWLLTVILHSNLIPHMFVGFSGLFQSVYKLHVTENPNGCWRLLFKSHWLVAIYYWESVYNITC